MTFSSKDMCILATNGSQKKSFKKKKNLSEQQDFQLESRGMKLRRFTFGSNTFSRHSNFELRQCHMVCTVWVCFTYTGKVSTVEYYGVFLSYDNHKPIPYTRAAYALFSIKLHFIILVIYQYMTFTGIFWC